MSVIPESAHRDLAEQGYCRIAIDEELRRHFFELLTDLWSYACVLCDDAGVPEVRSLVAEGRAALGTGDPVALARALEALLLAVGRYDRKLLGCIYDLGTRPMRLVSGRKVMDASAVRAVNSRFFAVEDPERPPILVVPYLGETLHVFPPGEENFKYNLPIHQDFPYLLQSERQLTYWLSLTDGADADMGGVRLYPGSHRRGLVHTRRSEHGHYEVCWERYPDFDESAHVDVPAEALAFYAVDSLLWHKSLRNTSADRLRLTYIFRFSDIGSARRVPLGAGADDRNKATFEQAYPQWFETASPPAFPAVDIQVPPAPRGAE